MLQKGQEGLDEGVGDVVGPLGEAVNLKVGPLVKAGSKVTLGGRGPVSCLQDLDIGEAAARGARGNNGDVVISNRGAGNPFRAGPVLPRSWHTDLRIRCGCRSSPCVSLLVSKGGLGQRLCFFGLFQGSGGHRLLIE